MVFICFKTSCRTGCCLNRKKNNEEKVNNKTKTKPNKTNFEIFTNSLHWFNYTKKKTNKQINKTNKQRTTQTRVTDDLKEFDLTSFETGVDIYKFFALV
jgi:hypothetical protein